ncbi:MAG TPA: L,D-transpeptidase [Verrucomicrobiales bacterium]|nr:L,D-transpeptidase [Verrucomicrobiales bacterium]
MGEQRVLWVSVDRQELWLTGECGEVLKRYPVSTSRFGLGFEEGSFCTPTGKFIISEKIGEGQPPGVVFRGREPAGSWQPGDPGEDLVLSRILWLHGVEPANANTKSRYIYIHGTHDEEGIGKPASHGCIRMRSADVIDLYDRVEVGDPVCIGAEPCLRR